MELFTITCTTCRARLKVRELGAIGQILACPKCDSMVQVTPPPGWQPPTEQPAGSAEAATSFPNSGSTISLRLPPQRQRPPATSSDAAGRGDDKRQPRIVAASMVAGTLASSTSAAAPPSAAEPAAVGVGASPVAASSTHAVFELFRQHWLLASLVPAASLTLVVGGWMLWGRSPGVSTPSELPPAAADIDAPSSEAAVAAARLSDVRPRQYDHWLPSEMVSLVRLPVRDLSEQPAVEGLLRRATDVYDDVVDPLSAALRVPKENIRRLTWAATNRVGEPSSERIAQGVAIVELVEPISHPQTLFEGCQPLELRLGGGVCYQPPAGAWAHPIVLVDERTILSGPLDLLRELSDRDVRSADSRDGKLHDRKSNDAGQPKMASAALTQAIELAGLESAGADQADIDTAKGGTQAILVVDLAAARRRPLGPAFAMLDHWPQGRDDWRTVRDLPAALLVRLTLREAVEIDVALVCDERTSAEKVHASLDQLAAAAASAIAAERESLSQRLVASTINATTADKLDLVFARSAAALTARQLQIDDTTVWMRTRIAADPPALAAAATTAAPAIESRRLEIARNLDEGNHQRLLTGLAGYEKAEQSWPLGAGGAALLPPENRLSWLATMLPYYGHVDWHRELNFGRPWNDAANRGVARRPLDLVVNPALGTTSDKNGFPLTHYVGVSGVGAGAGQLEAHDPRAGVFGFQRRIAQSAIGDGAANTIALLGVSGRMGPWAAGGDATVRPLTKAPYVNGPDGFGSGQADGMLAGMADGSVRFISKDVDPRVIEQLATINGGEPAQIERLGRPRPDAIVKDNPAVPGKPRQDDVAASAHATNPSDALSSHVPLPAAAKSTSQLPGNLPHIDVEARLNEKLPAIRSGQTTLAEWVELLGQLAGLEITLDPQALAEARIPPDELISVDLKDTTVREVLETVLSEHGLGYVVAGNQVLVTNTDRQRAALVKVTYDVADLAGEDPQALEQLAALVRRLVEPSSWQQAGGKGSGEIAQGRLVVDQNAPVQRQVLWLCEKLRVARGKSPKSSQGQKSPPGSKSSPDEERFSVETRFARAKPRLDAPVSANFNHPTPLAEVLAYLHQATGTQLLVDGPSLAALGLSRETKVTLVADKRPLSEALHGMLDPLKLAVRIIDGRTLQITSRGDWKGRLELEIYPAADLLGKDQPAAALLERVKSQLAQATWNDAGGPGVVEFDAESGCLLVLQTQDVQIRLEELLDTWRHER